MNYLPWMISIKYGRFHFTEEELINAVEKLDFGSAPGSSGWSFRSINALLTLKDGDTTTHRSCLLEFFNRAVSGELQMGVFKLWAISRSVLIPKDGKSFRPLGIGECFLRLLSKMVNDKFKSELGQKLAPLQLCVGIKGGAEIGARMAQIFYTEGKKHLSSIDIENAFNSIPRSLVLEGLEVLCPHLPPLFCLSSISR